MPATNAPNISRPISINPTRLSREPGLSFYIPITPRKDMQLYSSCIRRFLPQAYTPNTTRSTSTSQIPPHPHRLCGFPREAATRPPIQPKTHNIPRTAHFVVHAQKKKKTEQTASASCDLKSPTAHTSKYTQRDINQNFDHTGEQTEKHYVWILQIDDGDTSTQAKRPNTCFAFR